MIQSPHPFPPNITAETSHHSLSPTHPQKRDTHRERVKIERAAATKNSPIGGRQCRRCRRRRGSNGGRAAENWVVVAVRAEMEMSKTALAWALTHIVRPGDLVTLLAVLPDRDAASTAPASGYWRWPRRWWGFPRFGGGEYCRNRNRTDDNRHRISASVSQLALQIDGHNEVKVRIKVVGSESGADIPSSATAATSGGAVVAREAKRVGANWVVLDKKLKQEEKHCMEELQCCSIVVMKGSRAKVLRLNLGGLTQSRPFDHCDNRTKQLVSVLSVDSRSESSSSCRQEARTDNTSSSSAATAGAYDSAVACHKYNPLFARKFGYGKLGSIEDVDDSNDTASTPDSERSERAGPHSIHPRLLMDLPEGHEAAAAAAAAAASTAAAARRHGVFYIPQNHTFVDEADTLLIRQTCCGANKTPKESSNESNSEYNNIYSTDVREAVSLHERSHPCIPPPLCSLCHHKAPAFGKPMRRFAYRELDAATDSFSNKNLVGEGPLGRTYRGVLEDSRVVVAVKRLGAVGGLGTKDEFCAEVELMSRAQHRNIVTLVGFCAEGDRRVLVYEFICNGSLELHLYGNYRQPAIWHEQRPPLDWEARVKIALGVARGLRYLHEDCRVGYLAPEYMENGAVTEKCDVYAYGVVLLQLITGRRAMDRARPKGQQLLVEWARPLLFLASGEVRTAAVDRFLDSRLDKNRIRFMSRQLTAMAHAASLCLRRDPDTRPTMSKILRVLEGSDGVVEPKLGFGFESESVGSQSSRMSHRVNLLLHRDNMLRFGGSFSNRIPDEAVLNAIHAERNWSYFH
uniref:Protein kinase domain-containing protein n=1 Tax=Ananas comosus var. bracteatus TaxID=296719 RepID=A0A6V7NVI6_ANACO|nr:unnamed protein product [Ananas comosus var. bracteatus]